MSVVMDLQFDSIVKALHWWSVYSSGPNTLALPAFGSDEYGSFIEVSPQTRGGGLHGVAASFAVKSAYVGAGVPSFATEQVMDLNLGFAAGTAVACYDPDPARRGIFIKQGASGGGSWQQDFGQIFDKLWPDQNHPEKLLELVLCSWIGSIPCHPGAAANQGWTRIDPTGTNWTNAKVTFAMRAKDLYLGPTAKICQHIQADLPELTWAYPKTLTFSAQPELNSFVEINGVPFTFVSAASVTYQVELGGNVATSVANLAAALSASVDPAITRATYSAAGSVLTITPVAWQDAFLGTPFTIALSTKSPLLGTTNATANEPHATPNYLCTRSLISDQLGFGVNSWGHKNRVSHIVDSGRRDVVLKYTDDDADWECLGSVDRPLGYYDYVVAPVARALERLVGNSYMIAVHPKPQSDANTFVPVPGGVPEAERLAGKIRVYGIKVEI